MNISNESAIYDDMGHHNVFTIAVQEIMPSNFEPLANWKRGWIAEKIVSRNGERFCKCYEFHNVFSSSVVVSMPLLYIYRQICQASISLITELYDIYLFAYLLH